jgi:hypothetical protein
MRRIYLAWAFTSFLAVSEALAAGKAVGSFSAVRGFVSVVSGGNGFAKNVSEGDQVYAGDTVITGQNGRVRIVFPEAGRDAQPNVVVLSASSRMLVKRAGDGVSDKGAEMALQEGSVRANVKKNYYQGTGRDIFEIKTPNAVAGVRGTQFMVEYNFHKQQSFVATFEGNVVVHDNARRMQAEVLAGHYSEITKDSVSQALEFKQNGEVLNKLRRFESESRDLDRPARKEGDDSAASRSRVPPPPVAKVSEDILPPPPAGIGGGAWSQIRGGIPNGGVREANLDEEKAIKNLEMGGMDRISDIGGVKPGGSMDYVAPTLHPEVPNFDVSRVPNVKDVSLPNGGDAGAVIPPVASDVKFGIGGSAGDRKEQLDWFTDRLKKRAD